MRLISDINSVQNSAKKLDDAARFSDSAKRVGWICGVSIHPPNELILVALMFQTKYHMNSKQGAVRALLLKIYKIVPPIQSNSTKNKEPISELRDRQKDSIPRQKHPLQLKSGDMQHTTHNILIHYI